MPSKRELVTWAELLKLIADMAVAAVRHLGDNDPIDFEAIKIHISPEQALAQAKQARQGRSSETPDLPAGQAGKS